MAGRSFSGIDELLNAIDEKIAKTMEETVAPAIEDKLLESARMNVHATYSPTVYKRRTSGGITDPSMIVSSYNSQGLLTVMNVAPIEGPRLGNIGRHKRQSGFSKIDNNKTIVGSGSHLANVDNFEKLGLTGDSGNIGDIASAVGYQLKIGGKRYKGQTPLAYLIEHGAYNPWNERHYPWMSPRRFVTATQEWAIRSGDVEKMLQRELE